LTTLKQRAATNSNMYNRQITLATLAAIGAANGFFVNPMLAGNMGAVQLRTTTRSTTTTTVMMAAEDSKSDAVRRAELEADKIAAKAGVNQRVDGGVEAREVIREAPILKERIFEKTTEVDKTRIEEERIRTEVQQRVQPIKDERREAEDVKRVDHG
jgi:hypothetical protein